jgi:glycine dehydrogenase
MSALDPLSKSIASLFAADEFHARHLGPSDRDESAMLTLLGYSSRRDLIKATVPAAILMDEPLALPTACSEADALAELRALGAKNQQWRSYIGCGYFGTLTPEPIKRNVLENPGWYTAYTPYQAEVAQGRLEALLNFQQMVIDLTGMQVANASLLDEATAAAEAMAVCRRAAKSKAQAYFVEAATHPQVISVIRSRAKWMGIEVIVGTLDTIKVQEVFGAHFQSPDTLGRVSDFSEVIGALHASGAKACIGSDLLALMLIKSPGEMNADLAIGSAQRFGVPLGYGGPHAAFIAGKEELVRMLPGRIIGVSKDAQGDPALRMALQTREQHIRRDKATSNICTAQALLANMASFYAVYHGPEGLLRIALKVNAMARLLATTIASTVRPVPTYYFDTLVVHAGSDSNGLLARARAMQINLRDLGAQDANLKGHFSVSMDETVGLADIADLAYVLSGKRFEIEDVQLLADQLGIEPISLSANLRRSSSVLNHPVFNRYHSETEFVRYLKKLENKDISLVHSMIALGSCTMKLNAAAEMAPVTWPEFANLHPFVPLDQARGYTEMFAQLGAWLQEITGFAAISFQPNSGAQGEYAGLLSIRNYLASKGESHRNVCLIPSSAHGTNPASAQMMGMDIVVVSCDSQGNVDLADLKTKIELHGKQLAALMVTYPSTHGVFEASIKEICALVHEAGGQVYMDGANLNAQAGLTKPGLMGADVCHMNLHKTFCIPHGGGGPGMGPIAVAAHLAPFLPSDPVASSSNSVSAAPYGSALICTISWMYIRMMGASGIRKATEVAILNANYIAARLEGQYQVLYKGANGSVAHECILDLRHFKNSFGISAEDIAKRLIDYGFHAPTLSFPVVDTLMIEPTESESKAELDRFCEAMLSIFEEVQAVHRGELDKLDNPLKNAPHTAKEIAGDWTHGYSRDLAVFPLPYVREAKFWPSVKRVDNAAGDRHLVCTCPPMSDYETTPQAGRVQ